jgi:hypothetical protein
MAALAYSDDHAFPPAGSQSLGYTGTINRSNKGLD